MSWINMKSRRSFDFHAPYNEEGERTVSIPFPIAVKRDVIEGRFAHDANPALITVAPAGEEMEIEADVQVQPGALLIVRNEGADSAVVNGADCSGMATTTLMWDGNGYIRLGTTDIPEE